jgi:hypothetical protein
VSGRAVYFPVFENFLEGSIMSEPIPTRWLMIVLIGLASRPGADGIVDIPIPRLAQLAGMNEEDLRKSLDALMRPDPFSGSSEAEGRRLVPLDPARPDRGWKLVNFERYRLELRRANDAARKRRDRSKSENVRMRPHSSENGVKDTRREEKKREEDPPRPPASGGRVFRRQRQDVRALVGKSTLPPSPTPALRDPFGPDVPAEVRQAAQKRKAHAASDEALITGSEIPKPAPFHPAKSYGPDSRADERIRLAEWEEGDDAAFIRNREAGAA